MNGLEISAAALSVSAAAFIFCAAYLVLRRCGAARRQVRERVSRFREQPKSARYSIGKENKQKGLAGVHSSKRKFLDGIGNELLLANVIIKPEEFLVFWLVLIFVPAGLTALFTSRTVPSVTLMALGTVLPPLYVKRQQKKHTAKFESQLSDALMILCNCIRSGLSFQQALETSADQMEEPISREFKRAIREIRYGSSLERALNNMVERVGSVDLMLAVSAVNIQRQTGGNLSAILETIAGTIKERQKIKSDIRVLTATGRISGTVIGMLPIGIGLILLLVNPSYIQLFFQSQKGILMLVFAAVMEVVGFLFVKKIVTIKY